MQRYWQCSRVHSRQQQIIFQAFLLLFLSRKYQGEAVCENGVLFSFSALVWALGLGIAGTAWRRLFLQAPLNCVIHVSGSQMSLHTRLHSKRAIIYANSAALWGKTEAQGSLLVITQWTGTICKTHPLTKASISTFKITSWRLVHNLCRFIQKCADEYLRWFSSDIYQL